MEIRKVLLKNLSSLHVGGEGDIISIEDEAGLVEAVIYAKSKGFHTHVLGEGTNTYFGETLKNSVIIKNEIKGVACNELSTDYVLTVGAGETWDDVVGYAVLHNLWGIENLSYIPGTAGAAPVQNIGAYGMELKDRLLSLRAYDQEKGEFIELGNEDCLFGYRDSIFKRNPKRYIITTIKLLLSETRRPVLTYKPLDSLSDGSSLQEIRELVIKTRKEKLPDYTVYPNTGSFFKNVFITKEEGDVLQKKYPDIVLHNQDAGYKIPTAWLIEHIAQMKGARVGDVGTWPLQPLVIVNYGNATSIEINSFTDTIIEKIKEKTGIIVEREVNFLA